LFDNFDLTRIIIKIKSDDFLNPLPITIMKPDGNVIHLEHAHRSRAAQVLAEAFQDDPLYKLVLPDDIQRAKNLLWLFDKVALVGLLYGDSYATRGLEGVICCLPPGGTTLTVGHILRTGLYAIVFKFGWAAYRRFDDNLSYAEKLHKQLMPEPHWYLWAIGVDPTCHGQGIGSALLQPVLASATETGLPCYLETHNEANIRFYQKHGFTVAQEGIVSKYNLPVWAMRRDP
jgi:ribosomal protein S18 acetylase RimI-like enzyme